MYDRIKSLINDAQSIVVIQPENPDADSLGSALALEEILGDAAKSVTLYCAIDMPKYLHYIEGWSRVDQDWKESDLAIIVDTSAAALLEKTLDTPHIRHFLETHPVIVIDHHVEGDDGDNDLPFQHELVQTETAAATSEIILDLTHKLDLAINPRAASAMLASILGDTLGLSTPSVTADTVRAVATLIDLGAHPAEVESARREYMKKPADILEYKGELLQRVQYACDGRLAIIQIPWEEIEQYSDRYNPSVLVIDEMRLVEGVDVAVAVKTYPDGKLTGKIRTNVPVGDTIAGYFGGGGHAYSAGFKIYESFEKAYAELVKATEEALRQHDSTI